MQITILDIDVNHAEQVTIEVVEATVRLFGTQYIKEVTDGIELFSISKPRILEL